MFSGGLDSTASLLHVLQNSDEYGDILVHHIQIENMENRWPAEAKAVAQVLDYMRIHTSTAFIYSSSKINTPRLGNHFLLDTEIISFLTGYMTSRDPLITKVIIGATATDFQMTGADSTRRGKAIHNAFFDDGEDHSAMVKDYPLKDMTKEEIYESLPKDLVGLTWSCRRPVYVDGIPTECGECKTCVKEMEGVRALRITNKER